MMGVLAGEAEEGLECHHRCASSVETEHLLVEIVL
jgi:hypothetical protein